MSLGTRRLSAVILSPAMSHPRKRLPSSATPINPQQISPSKRRKAIRTNPEARTKKPGALATLSASIASAIGSSSQGPSEIGVDQPETSESRWRTAYVAARMAVEIAKESSDMFLPLKAVVGAVSVLIKNYDVKCTQALCLIDP